MADTYRSWLQSQANQGVRDAGMALNLQGDDGGIDGYYQERGQAITGFGPYTYQGTIDRMNDLYGQYQNRDGGPVQGAVFAEGSNTTGGTGGTAPANTAADERAYYDDQIGSLNSLLGLTNSQRDNGLANLGVQRDRLNDSRTKAMSGYDAQSVESGQDKQRGVEQVDQFANNSYTNLQRILQGGNAGNSSAARELVPYLVSKGAGARRQGVFDQAGKNDQAIATARGDAETQFKWNEEDLGGQEKSFREGILNKQNDLTNQRRNLEIQRAQADGSGYATARAAGEASRNTVEGRMAELNSLFGQFKPTYRDPNLQKPELGKFTVDPAQIRTDASMPAESRYYLSQIQSKKKNELGL